VIQNYLLKANILGGAIALKGKYNRNSKKKIQPIVACWRSKANLFSFHHQEVESLFRNL